MSPTIDIDRSDGVMLHLSRILTPPKQFSASMWTAEEAAEIRSLARSIVPNIKTHAIPTGLQVEGGPDAIVKHLLENVPALLDS